MTRRVFLELLFGVNDVDANGRGHGGSIISERLVVSLLIEMKHEQISKNHKRRKFNGF